MKESNTMSDEATTGDVDETPVPAPDVQPEPVDPMMLILSKLEALDDRMSALEKPQTPPAPQPAGPEALPEGTTRFFSPTRELAIKYVAEDENIVNGKPVLVPTTIRGVRSPHDYTRTAQFIGGVLDVTDPVLADYLRSLPEFGNDYWEDPNAHRQLSGTSVLTGPRGADVQPQAEPALTAIIP